MRFIIFVQASADPDAALPADVWNAEMKAYHDALARAGVLLDAASLQPRSAGWRLRCVEGECHAVDAPAEEPSGQMAAYTVIEARSRAEAMEWARRFPAPAGPGVAAEIEVRPLLQAVSGTPPDRPPSDGSPSDGSPPDGSPPDGSPPDGSPPDGPPSDGSPSNRRPLLH